MQISPSKTNLNVVEMKNITTLIVDEQLDDATYLNEPVEGIEFTICKSLSKAFDILDNQNFDIALCNMNAPPALLKEFFQKYNSVLPIVAFSSSIDPRLAYVAAQLKARDFIFLQQLNYREISQTLQKIRSEWVEEQQAIMVEHFLQEPQNRIILRELLVSDLPISQRIVSNCINEIQIDDSIKKAYGIKTNEILVNNPSILNRMVKMNALIKEKTGQTLACPNCSSVNIYTNFHCSNCNSSRFKRKELFFHRPCNQIISVKKYSNSGEIFCNECMIHFENAFSNCYNILGFECIHCYKAFATPSILYTCNECNYEKFDLNSAKWIDLYKFRIRDDYVNKLKSNLFSLMQLEDFLTQSGFTVKHYEHFIENKNSHGPFDLIAYSQMTTLIFITLGNDLTRDIEKILEIEKLPIIPGKKVKTFAISSTSPVKSIKNLLKKFNITSLVEEENDKHIQNILMKSFTPNIF
ncbi:MAG TPA: response regulator [Candidatus Nitrosocosmicus sp.]|nr:response regulator [Candidatus Nitrosocosmicus sp.]